MGQPLGSSCRQLGHHVPYPREENTGLTLVIPGELKASLGAVGGAGRCTQLRSGSQEEGVQWLGSLVEVRLGLQLWLCDFLGEPLSLFPPL